MKTSIVEEQGEFLRDVSRFVLGLFERGILATGGELYRTEEQQALHVKAGRSWTMDSKHRDRLAEDLNFFRKREGRWRLVEKDEAFFREIAEYWKSLSDKNYAGADFKGKKYDPCHFERRP